MNIEQAIDILKNSIADYVIGEYCEKCADNKICDDRNEDCYFQQAIDMVITAYEKEKEENMSYYYHIQGLEDDIRMHYISTYKIEKEIKKIKDSNTYGYVGEEWNDRDVVELLENLISKEE